MDVSAFTPPAAAHVADIAVARSRNTLMPAGSVARVDVRDMSASDFARQYDDPCKPAILLGAMNAWPAGEWAEHVCWCGFAFAGLPARGNECLAGG